VELQGAVCACCEMLSLQEAEQAKAAAAFLSYSGKLCSYAAPERQPAASSTYLSVEDYADLILFPAETITHERGNL
jgi:hypothetical protein